MQAFRLKGLRGLADARRSVASTSVSGSEEGLKVSGGSPGWDTSHVRARGLIRADVWANTCGRVGGCCRSYRLMQPHELSISSVCIGFFSLLHWHFQPHELALSACCIGTFSCVSWHFQLREFADSAFLVLLSEMVRQGIFVCLNYFSGKDEKGLCIRQRR